MKTHLLKSCASFTSFFLFLAACAPSPTLIATQTATAAAAIAAQGTKIPTTILTPFGRYPQEFDLPFKCP